MFRRGAAMKQFTRVGAIIREQQRIKSGSGVAEEGLGGGAGMKALCYIAALTVIAAILVVSTSFTERRNVKTWAPNAVIAKPKPFETAAIVSPKRDAATGAVKSDAANPALAPEQSASGAEAPAATRSSTTVTDPESTGTLPKAVAPTAHYVAPNVSPAPSRALRDRPQATRPARQAPAHGPVIAQTRPASALPSREPIQFRLAEGRN